jgi:hypothetical protein
MPAHGAFGLTLLADELARSVGGNTEALRPAQVLALVGPRKIFSPLSISPRPARRDFVNAHDGHEIEGENPCARS